LVATNPDGTWNLTEAAAVFDVLPAFWQTLWFRLSIVLASIACVVALYRLRMHQMTRRLSMRFEERLAERTRIAQELHDTLLQGFLSASMQLNVAVDQLPPDTASKPALTRVNQLMNEVIEEARNAVRGLRSPISGALDLERAFSDIRREMNYPDAGFRVIVEGLAQPLHPVLRDEIFRIGREAIVNAFRHSQARSIEVELEYTAAKLRVLVRDDGRGIDAETLESGREGHWGLIVMRERAERIGAQLRLWSKVSAGTEVELSVPGSVAFGIEVSRDPARWLPWKRLARKWSTWWTSGTVHRDGRESGK
jgi:signal transduction histidine kinase